jgi:PHD/YefM family antitoxin component YafN of YafNO toxin-antitoxin module
MPKVPEMITITDLRQDAAAVMLSAEAYERAEQERQILLLLARGDREIRRGKGHDLDAVLAEADRLLAGS